MKQLLEGLDHCHLSGITHRDLKADNLLLDENYDLKIADFGFAGPSSGTNGTGLHKSLVGTTRYMAPEIKTNMKGYRGPPADLFAVGVLLFVMVTARFPFTYADPTIDKLFYAISFSDSKFFWAYHDKINGTGDLSAEMKDLITSLLQAKPLHRPAICDLLAQPWFAGPTPNNADIIKEFQQRD